VQTLFLVPGLKSRFFLAFLKPILFRAFHRQLRFPLNLDSSLLPYSQGLPLYSTPQLPFSIILHHLSSHHLLSKDSRSNIMTMKTSKDKKRVEKEQKVKEAKDSLNQRGTKMEQKVRARPLSSSTLSPSLLKRVHMKRSSQLQLTSSRYSCQKRRKMGSLRQSHLAAPVYQLRRRLSMGK